MAYFDINQRVQELKDRWTGYGYSPEVQNQLLQSQGYYTPQNTVKDFSINPGWPASYQPQAANWNTNNTGGTNMADGLPGAGGTTGTGSTGGFSWMEDVDPATLYYRKYGLLQPGMGPGGQWMKSLQPLARTNYDIRSALAAAGYEAPGTFESSLPSWAPGATPPVYSQSRNALQQLFALDPAQRGEAGLGFGSGELAEGIKQADLSNLLYSALRPIMGQVGAKWLASRVGVMGERWRAEQPEPGEGNIPKDTFLDALKQKYNLASYGF